MVTPTSVQQPQIHTANQTSANKSDGTKSPGELQQQISELERKIAALEAKQGAGGPKHESIGSDAESDEELLRLRKQLDNLKAELKQAQNNASTNTNTNTNTNANAQNAGNPTTEPGGIQTPASSPPLG